MAKPPESESKVSKSEMDIDMGAVKKGNAPQSSPEQEERIPDAQREEIESRLGDILESDLGKGREKVSLFAARCALRLLPFGFDRQFTDNNDKNSPVGFLFIIWRSAMVAWNFLPEIAANAGNAAYTAKATKATNAAPFDDAATNAAYAAVATNAAPFDAAAANAAYAAIAANTAFVANTALIAATLDDLGELEVPAQPLALIRRKPLWGEKGIPTEISRLDWQSEIDGLSQSTEIESEKNLLKKIKRDYQAILNGTWDEEKTDTETKTQTRDTAVEKPEDDSPSADDFLGRDKLVKVLEPRLSIPDDSNHLTVGLLGNWGIGKSSVIEQLQKKLDKNNSHTEYLYGNFNAWSYEKTQNLQAGITHEMISALTSARKLWPWYQRWIYKPLVIGEFAAQLHGWRITGILIMLFVLAAFSMFIVEGNMPGIGEIEYLTRGIFGAGSIALILGIFRFAKNVVAQPLAKELQTYLRLPSYQEHLGTIPVMEKQIKTLCEICLNRLWSNKQRRLIFFIDDLDRCGVDGIVQTFEAVRLVLGIRWVTVIIAMDQRIALPALACHYKQLSEFHQNDPMSIARDYLGKVIHLPVSLPPPDDLGVAQYLAKIWKDPDFYESRKPKQITIDSVVDGESGQDQLPGEDVEKPKESLQDIIDDINAIDVRAALMPENETLADPPEETDIETIQQLSAHQKVAFYDWLLKLNLRNPRQVKRLYNSYNLLWSNYSKDWPGDEHNHPYLVALFVLEMINEYVVYSETEDTKAHLRQEFFSIKDAIHMPEIPGVSFEVMSEARQVIYGYQKNFPEINLLVRIEPFVLPASSPHRSENK